MSADAPRRPWPAAVGSPHAQRRSPPHKPDESFMARALRYAPDRRQLADMDERLLLDIGLDRQAVAAGIPFQDPLTQHRLAHQHRSRKP